MTSPRRVRRAVRLTLLAVLALVASMALSGCSGSGFSAGEKGFVSGDGTVTVLDAVDRGVPAAEVAGEDLDGDPVALADLRGKVVVMPVWGSWCGPCRAEAAMLGQAARDLAADDVAFLGINSRDPDRVKAQRFVEGFDVDYPSIYDPDGVSLLAFRGTLPPMTVPSFVFIDAQGRIAARALDSITRTTLEDIVAQVRDGGDSA